MCDPSRSREDAARLAAGRPTTIRAPLRAKGGAAAHDGEEIEPAHDPDGERVERTLEDGSSRPGLNNVQPLPTPRSWSARAASRPR